MDNEQLVKLRDRILEIPGFADRLAELERFCIDNKAGCLSRLCFHEWATNKYGESALVQGRVPMASTTIEERAAFRDWAVAYYKRTNPMATVEGRIQWFEAKAAKAPDRTKLVEAGLRKTQDEHRTYCGGHPGQFALGQKYAREGDAPDFLDYNAYSPQVSQMLLGYANFHYLLFLERGQNSIAAKAQAPAIMESHEVRQLYRKVLEIPELASTLNPYQKAELKKMADSDILEALYFVNAYLPANPGQVYPPKYVGREVDYWLEIGHSAGAEATRMRKILASPTPADSQPQNSIATKDQPPASSDLENYLTDTGKPIVPFILTNYKKAKPQSITALFFAMKDLGMCGEPSSLDCTKLHNDLKAELGIVFVRQALSKSINDFNKGGKEPLVNAAKTGIRNYLAILATR